MAILSMRCAAATSCASLVLFVMPAVAQNDPPPPAVLNPGDFEPHSNSGNPELTFQPLAPQQSEYWSGLYPQTFESTSIPLPPLAIVSNIYSAFGDELGDWMGSAISAHPLFWQGDDYNSNTGLWKVYTTETDLYSQSGGATANWHNWFQYSLSIPNSSFPPAWPTTGPAAANFTDWVDLYAPYLSRAFFDDFGGWETSTYSNFDATDGFGRYGFPRIGSPQHVDLPPTYPPLTNNVWDSTSPLVPSSGGDSIGVYSDRESVAGRLDLITGEPLLTETDIELEFGSAVFRRIRTYSERADHGIKQDYHRQVSFDVESWTRGWHGSGWMSSEVPLFFFEASQPGTITTGQEDQIGPVCYFVPDAHHSIPFVQQARGIIGTTEGVNDYEEPDYIAPDWFDAMLLYDKSTCEWGDTDPDTTGDQLGWITPPTEMKVYLHNRSVIYTIKMYYEDVDPVQHRRPQVDENGYYPDNLTEINYGVPYYGLVTSIEDKSGNRVEITYVDSEKHKPYWDPDPEAREAGMIDTDEDFEPDTVMKMPVRQKGWYKGMVDYVKLYPAGSSEAKWSLFYTYRTFYSERDRSESFFKPGEDRLSDFVNYFDHLSHPPALHSLLVYERDVLASEIETDRELILPCDSTTYGPAEHVQSGDTPPSFVDLLIDYVSGTNNDDDNDGDIDIVRVFAKPAVGTENNPLDHQDGAIGPTGHGESLIDVLPEDWTHQVRYSYADPMYYGEYDDDGNYTDGEWSPVSDYTLASCGPVEINDNYWVWQRARSAYLLKTALFSRAEADDQSMQDLPPQFWLYRYQDVEGAGADAPQPYPAYSGYRYWSYGTSAQMLPRRMSHRYGPETIGRIYRNRPPESETCGYNAFVNGLIAMNEDAYVDGQVCYIEPPDPDPSGGGGNTQPGHADGPGGQFGYDDAAGPYVDPDDGTIQTSTTHQVEESDTNNLPIGLLADTIFYRWSEPYRLDPRLLSTDPGPDGLVARPASWGLFDGRIDGTSGASDFNTDLRDNYVGGSVSAACESSLGLTITQADQANTGFLPGGTGVYSTINEGGSVKWYRVYRFITAPETPVDWRGSLYGATQSPAAAVPLGPEVIWDMQEYPDHNYGDDPSEIANNVYATHALYYYPFNFVATEWGSNIDDAQAVNIDRSKPMWWVVVDEYDSIEEALSVNSSMAYSAADPNDFIYNEYQFESPWSNRRVVGMNSTGMVLSDRTWTNDGNTASTDDPPAILEAWSYDDYLRPILKLTRGWGAAAASTTIDETQNGLVEVYTYDQPYQVNMGSPGHGADPVIITLAPRTPLTKAIRKGCDAGNDIQVSSIEYYDDPEAGSSEPQEWKAKLPKVEKFYDLLGVEIGVIEHFYGHWSENELPADADTAQPPLRWQVRVGPVYQRSPNAADVRSIDGQWFNNKGQVVWRVYGSMEDPVPDASGHISVSGADEVFLDYYQYDEDGRQILMVQDIELAVNGQGFGQEHLVFPGHPTDAAYAGGNADQPDWQQLPTTPMGTLFLGDDEDADDLSSAELSAMLGTIGTDQTTLIGASMYRQAEADPLNRVTFRAYNNFGQYKVVHPNGSRDITHYVVESGYLRELRAMGVDFDSEEGEWQFSGQGLFDSEFQGQAFTEGIQAAIAELEAGQWSGSPYDLESGVFADYRLEVISEITPNYDTAGRLVSLTVADETESAEPIRSSISYDGWGNTLLEISPDRLIKRYKYDGLGRLHKTFVGSKDRHTIWRTSTEQDEDDDLILTEKLYYGTSPTDAFMPITKWMYRDKSGPDFDQQYTLSEFFEPSDDQAGTATAFATSDMPDGASSPGRIEHYGYDWRMRKVSTKYEDFEADNQGVYREERMFYDNLDRVRYTAVYGPEATQNAPSPDIAPGLDLPLPSAFVASGANTNLLSLEETVYNEAGQVVERRRYDPQGNGGYLATHSYTDHADRAIWSSSSSGRVTRNVYDAKGRVARTSEYAGDGANAIELTRSVQMYGPDDNVEEVRYYERLGDFNPGSAANIDSVPHRLTVSYTWYDTRGRVISTADMGSAEFDVSVAGDYDRVMPARPADSPEITEEVGTFISGTTDSTRKVLVGVEYPVEFFDSTTGEAVAKLTCYWYDRLGKQNAVLNVISASRDLANSVNEIEYTIDRTEYNRYGQKVLEHKYAYVGTGSSFLQGDFELLNGMEYSYEAEVYLQGETLPSTLTTTQVRSITPLNVDPAIMTVDWDDENSTRTEVDGEVVYTVSGTGHFVATWHNTSERRTTILEYGAPVIDPDYQLPSYVLHPSGPIQFPITSNDWGHIGISNRPDLIKAVHLPNPTGGGTGDGLGYSMFFFYHPDGLPAVRVDSRGVGIKYVYDADGNLIRLSSDDTNIPLLAENPSMIDEQRPPNAIEYTYDTLSRLLSVTTGRDFADGTFWRRSRSDLVYTSLGNLDRETQSRYEEYDNPSSPDPLLETAGIVDYAWDTKLRHDNDPVDHTNNVNRLLSITYPNRVGTHDDGAYLPRVVTLGYGVMGGVSDLLDRVESLTSTDGPAGAELGHVATYRYDGLNRLRGVDLGDVPNQTSPTFVHTDDRAFDLFGRIINRHVQSFDIAASQPGYQTILDSDFGYDLRGQRIYERLAQLAHPSLGTRTNTHSSFFDYDALGRLIGEHYGTLKADGFEGIDHASSLIDPLALTYGLDSLNRRVGISSAPGISIWEDADKDDVVDVGELLTQTHEIDARGGLTGLDDGSVIETVAQDESGAITELHGRKLYHDWLGRPILVLDSNGTDLDTSDDTAVFAVDYDGFGRVAQRRAPWPNSDPALGLQRIESYFYDGVRRIQEVFNDPKAATPPWPVQAPGGFGGGGGYTGDTKRTEAEFIWSAASGQPFDTCHVQVDWWDREAWFVQDHQTGTVRAYTDANGEMVRQYRFDGFGNLLNLDTFPLAGSGGLFNSFQNRLGHQGLFAERVDSHTRATVFAANGPEIWYQSRSRWYVPELGRFVTSDPNTTGVPTMKSLAMLGKAPVGSPGGSFDVFSHYGNGWDTWTAYGANPLMYQDPTGLFTLAGLLNTATARAAGVGALGGGTVGGLVGGISSAIQGQNILIGIFKGAAVGAVAGGTGGAAGVGIAGAFGSAGIGGGLTAGLIGAGAVDGGLGAFLDTILSGGSIKDAFRAGAYGAAIGGVTAGILDQSTLRFTSRLRATHGQQVYSALRNGDNIMGVTSTMSGNTAIRTVAADAVGNGIHAELATEIGSSTFDGLKIGYSLFNNGDGTFSLGIRSRGVNGIDTPDLAPDAASILRQTLEQAFGVSIR